MHLVIYVNVLICIYNVPTAKVARRVRSPENVKIKQTERQTKITLTSTRQQVAPVRFVLRVLTPCVSACVRVCVHAPIRIYVFTHMWPARSTVGEAHTRTENIFLSFSGLRVNARS